MYQREARQAYIISLIRYCVEKKAKKIKFLHGVASEVCHTLHAKLMGNKQGNNHSSNIDVHSRDDNKVWVTDDGIGDGWWMTDD